jgi:hypothetical protein
VVSFKDEWNLSMALEVLGSDTVDGRVWADAIKWLLLYGPPEISELIGQASLQASSEYFPDLKPAGFDDTGQPVYTLRDLADSLGISEEEARLHMDGIEDENGLHPGLDWEEVKKIQ